MGDKRAKILEAARELFIRHGFRRTTMGDIAAGAEMSRPAVYLVYPNKEEIFRGVMKSYLEQSSALAGERCESHNSLAAKIRAVLDTWVVDAYRLISQSPEADEIYESTHSFTADLRGQFVRLVETQLVEVIEASPELDRKALRDRDLTVEQVSRLLAHSTLQLKRTVADLDDLVLLVETAVKINMTALTTGVSRSRPA